MIVVVDNSMGNVGSVGNMIKRAGGEAVISNEPDVILNADKLVLPGVGAFDSCMTRLRQAPFFKILERKVVLDETPILGICAGMQMFFDKSEEGIEPGLGWIRGSVKKLDTYVSAGLKVPHMGWNTVKPMSENKLLKSTETEHRFYFVHSYYAECENSEDILAKTTYGLEFVCAVHRNNIFGVQFHPEKSHRFGLSLMKNFTEL